MFEEAVALSPDAWVIIAYELSRRSGKSIDASQIRFARERSSQNQRVSYVELDREDLGDWGKEVSTDRAHFIFSLVAHDDTWALGGYSGPSSIQRPQPSQPRAYLAGGHGTDGLNAGGFIDGAGTEVTRAELRFNGHQTVSDVPDRGVALFVADEPVAAPVSVTLFDNAGNELVRHPVLPG